MKTRSFHTIGVELPSSGNGIFQRTFSVALHFTGTSFSVQIPCPVGPRQPGQSAALAKPVSRATTPMARRKFAMIESPRVDCSGGQLSFPYNYKGFRE